MRVAQAALVHLASPLRHFASTVFVQGSPESRDVFRRLLDVTAEPVAHRREHPVGEVGLAARVEALVEGRGQHVRRHGLVDRGRERPAALAGIRDPALVGAELRILEEGARG